MQKLLFIFLFLFWCSLLYSQVTLKVVFGDSTSMHIWQQAQSEVSCKKCKIAFHSDTIAISVRDSVSATRYLLQNLQSIRKRGYLAATLDEIGALLWRFESYQKFHELRCQLIADSSLKSGILKDIDLDSSRTMTALSVAQLQETVFFRLENNGYPFATVRTECTPGQDTLAKLIVNQGRRCTFGVPINPDFPVYFLRHITKYRKGEWYSYERVSSLETELRKQNEWVTLAGAPKMVFVGDEVQLKLPLKAAQPNRFDFILGLLPNPATGRSTITGTLDARLFNALKAAEVLELHFERLRPLNQRLDVQARIPFVASLPFGASGQIQMYRRDSAFLDVALRAGLLYPMPRGQLDIFWVRNTSDVLQVDTQFVLNNLRLPATLDLKSNQFALAYTLRTYDNRYSPRRGFGMMSEARVGLVDVIRNANIEQLRRADKPDFSFSSLYDTLSAQGNRYQFNLQADAFIPLGRQSTFRFGTKAGMLASDARLLQNELFRLGGYELVRGFDEDIFFASAFVNTIGELRLLTGERSFFSVFGEYSVLNLGTTGAASVVYPLALGAGLQLETRGGVLGLSLAVGKLGNQAFDFRAPKIHIGYLSNL